jgi:hypothetical protein
VVERELVTAHFENEKKMEKKFKAPGSARTSSQARHNHPLELHLAASQVR